MTKANTLAVPAGQVGTQFATPARGTPECANDPRGLRPKDAGEFQGQREKYGVPSPHQYNPTPIPCRQIPRTANFSKQPSSPEKSAFPRPHNHQSGQVEISPGRLNIVKNDQRGIERETAQRREFGAAMPIRLMG